MLFILYTLNAEKNNIITHFRSSITNHLHSEKSRRLFSALE